MSNPVDSKIINAWKAAGGHFHGPNVETATLPKDNLGDFVAQLKHNNSLMRLYLNDAVIYSRDPRALLTTSPLAGLKLMEEVGEFAEAILIEGGYLPHKPPPKEPAMGEAADIILMVVQVLANHHPELDPNRLISQLTDQVGTKLKKWKEKVLEFDNEDTGE